MGMIDPKASEKLEVHLGNLIKEGVEHFNGNGGGSPVFGQGFIPNTKLNVDEIKNYLKTLLLNK
jgi:alanyl-tRNA synthetase